MNRGRLCHRCYAFGTAPLFWHIVYSHRIERARTHCAWTRTRVWKRAITTFVLGFPRIWKPPRNTRARACLFKPACGQICTSLQALDRFITTIAGEISIKSTSFKNLSACCSHSTIGCFTAAIATIAQEDT